MQRLQRPAQRGREIAVPLLAGQVADFAFRAEADEDGPRRPHRRPGIRVPSAPPQHEPQVPQGLGLELRALVRPRAIDHLAQHALGHRELTLHRRHRRLHPQIPRLLDERRDPATDLPHALQVATRRLELTAEHADLRPAADRQRCHRLLPGRLGFRHGPVGLAKRRVERTLLPIGYAQVMGALRHAVADAGPLAGGPGDLPRFDRRRVPPPQMADDPQIVGGAAGRRQIAVPAGDLERAREIVPGLLDPPAHEGEDTPGVEGARLQRLLAAPAGAVERHVQPAEAFVVAPEARLRRPIQQREARRPRTLVLVARAEIGHHLRMTPGRGQPPGSLHDQRRRHYHDNA